VEIERQMRFPWAGGRHPWLDAAIETNEALVGVESRRFEPFRDAKGAALSPAYDRDVWGGGMAPYAAMRDRIRSHNAFQFLDAVQLVKHAFGLVTEARRAGKRPVLLYLFAEPAERAGKAIPVEWFRRHREEVSQFAFAVAEADVRFAACSYREWLETWTGVASAHRDALINRFAP
jgi:hypothetical protein